MWDVETALKRYVRAKRVIVIADVCHAAGVPCVWLTALFRTRYTTGYV